MPIELHSFTPAEAYLSPPDSDAFPDLDLESPERPTFNMLNVLARVANDQPLESPSSTSPVTTATTAFERASFLAAFRDDARSLDPDPYRGLAVLEEGLEELFKPAESCVSPSEEIVHARIDQPRPDIAPEYDVVSRGCVSEVDAAELAAVYWERIHPVTRVLDPEIHTLGYLRASSATLTTVVLMVAAQCLPVSEHANSLVAQLEGHLEYLLTETDKQCYQSLEICQALLMFVVFLSGHKLNRAWPLAAKAMSMAIELRLDISPPPRWALDPSPHHSASQNRLIRNVERLWLLTIDWDRGSAFFRGRPAMLREHPAIVPAKLVEWSAMPDALPCDAMTGACLELLGMFVNLQIEASQLPIDEDGSLPSQLAVDVRLDKWRSTWLHRLTPEDCRRARFDLDGFRVILLMTPYHRGIERGWVPTSTALGRDACLGAALEHMKGAIPLLSGTDPLMTLTSLYSYR